MNSNQMRLENRSGNQQQRQRPRCKQHVNTHTHTLIQAHLLTLHTICRFYSWSAERKRCAAKNENVTREAIGTRTLTHFTQFTNPVVSKWFSSEFTYKHG